MFIFISSTSPWTFFVLHRCRQQLQPPLDNPLKLFLLFFLCLGVSGVNPGCTGAAQLCSRAEMQANLESCFFRKEKHPGELNVASKAVQPFTFLLIFQCSFVLSNHCDCFLSLSLSPALLFILLTASPSPFPPS